MESILPICRICLNTSSECIDFQTVFLCNSEKEGEVTTNAINYLECLRFCTQLSIMEHDGGPQCLCTTCESELQVVYRFIQKAKKSHAILEENLGTAIFNSDEQSNMLIGKIKNATGDKYRKPLTKAKSLCSDNETLDHLRGGDKEETEEVLIKAEFETNECDFLPEDTEEQEQQLNNFTTNNVQCHICNRTYTTAYLLKAHLKYHERKAIEHKSDACEICGKQFSTQRYLAQHMLVHQESRETYKCHYCDKEYITKTALNNHKRIHRGETLECFNCGKQFTRSYELKIHMRFHKREYPFECEMCDKKFAIKGHLRTHMWQHQGIKLECEECGKLLGSTKALNEHSYVHSEMPYPCQFCSKAYPSKQKYKMHLDKMHPNEIKDFDSLQLESLSNSKNVKRRKNFTFVQILEEQVVEAHKQARNNC